VQLPDPVLKAITGIHRAVFRASNGRLANRGSGMPVLMLTTTGRKSGRRRETMLTTPIQDHGRILLVASNGGATRHPDWFLNLREHPEVEVTMGGATRPMTAHVADPTERAELWPRIVADHGNYGDYQERTDRDIPVVVLEPHTS
jgi:deazaflavin-dependent oxidoreductase (nitroreductase family)